MEALLVVVGGWGKRAVGTAPDNGINAICVFYSVCARESVCLCGVCLCVCGQRTCLIDIACSDSNRLEN